MAARKRKVPATGQPGQLVAVKPPSDLNAALRAKQALELVIQGHSYGDAAQIAGYSSRSACWTAVHRELARSLKPPTDELRELEAQRLDALLRTFMPKALKGDGWSCDRVLRIAEARRKLLGLDFAPRVPPEDRMTQMVVIGVPQEVADAV